MYSWPKCWFSGKHQIMCWVLKETCRKDEDVFTQISFCFLKKKKKKLTYFDVTSLELFKA